MAIAKLCMLRRLLPLMLRQTKVPDGLTANWRTFSGSFSRSALTSRSLRCTPLMVVTFRGTFAESGNQRTSARVLATAFLSSPYILRKKGS